MIKDAIRKVILIGTYGIMIYSVPHVVVGIPIFFTEKINDKEHLQRVINEEKVKLGLQNENIRGFYMPDYGKSKIKDYLIPAGAFHYDYKHSGAERQEGHDIAINSSIGMRRGIVRHELAHIAHGDCLKKDGMMNPAYWVYQELLANIYGGLGIDINNKNR